MNLSAPAPSVPRSPSPVAAMAFTAMAGGLGWGIRGQYGHETGAMIAGLLVFLTLATLFGGGLPLTTVLRAVAWGTVGIGIGGSMTYGQTVGLTHDPALVGNWEALRWGMLGLGIKGGLWIGFAGALFGMALGGSRYRAGELTLLFGALLLLFFAGTWLLNSPFDPSQKVLPRIYFSADWRWQPEATLRPRREVWGGLLFALVGLLAYTGVVRRDPLAPRLAAWGVLGGFLGFPAGQSLQAAHAWNLDLIRSGAWAAWDSKINWWNFMETTFGAVMGACLALGTWWHRDRLVAAPHPGTATLPWPAEILLMILHVTLLMLSEFTDLPWIGLYTDLGLLMVVLPVAAIATGRWWPYALLFPITLLPIAGKTVREMVIEHPVLPPVAGWALYGIAPVLLAAATAVWFERRAQHGMPTLVFARSALLLSVWLYFGLNFAFFRFPWPWNPWTARTPNALVFLVCGLGLTVLARSRYPSGSLLRPKAYGSP
ncbi:MAG: hypothetical protein JNK85_28670 [Verrucomicrobiales bacterium]|nr:hypothetical protein [Verrucomicrobiales bacterium]